MTIVKSKETTKKPNKHKKKKYDITTNIRKKIPEVLREKPNGSRWQYKSRECDRLKEQTPLYASCGGLQKVPKKEKTSTNPKKRSSTGFSNKGRA